MRQAVIITGATGGIGTALCSRLRSDGYHTIGLDREPVSHADTHFQADLSDHAALVELGRELAATYAVKAIIHNGAVQPLGGAGQTSLAEWIDALSVNVIAVDALVSGTREALAANDGSVVVVSSVHARATSGGVTTYATTKAALEGWVRSAALDLGPTIRVNAVAPGAIDTPKLREGFARWGDESAAERRAVLVARTALRRIGAPDDVAGPVSFLIGADARFITGTVLVADGGATARLGTE